MNTRETPCGEIGGETSIDSENNSDGTRAEFPSLPAPLIPSQQHGIETRQAVQPSQQTSIATALSIPQNVSYPPPGYAMPPYSGQFYPFQYGMPPYGFMTFPTQQLPHSLRQIAPKPQGDTSQTNTSSFSSQPPDFIETVKKIRKQLYDRSGVDELQEPPSEGEVYSKWRKSVFQEWKPVSILHLY